MTALAGDYCNPDLAVNCNTGFHCVSGTCKAINSTLGANCTKDAVKESTLCDIGQYCSAFTGKCTAYVALGKACNTQDNVDVSPCGPVNQCLQTLTSNSSDHSGICIKPASIPIGTLVANSTSNDNTQILSGICESFYGTNDFVNTTQYYCFTAPTLSTDNAFNGQNMSTNCTVNYFESSADLKNVTKKTVTPPLCGFNINDLGYCPLNLGDAFSQNIHIELITQAPAAYKNCHALSNLYNCTAYKMTEYNPLSVSGNPPKSWSTQAPFMAWFTSLGTIMGSSNQ